MKQTFYLWHGCVSLLHLPQKNSNQPATHQPWSWAVSVSCHKHKAFVQSQRWIKRPPLLAVLLRSTVRCLTTLFLFFSSDRLLYRCSMRSRAAAQVTVGHRLLLLPYKGSTCGIKTSLKGPDTRQRSRVFQLLPRSRLFNVTCAWKAKHDKNPIYMK